MRESVLYDVHDLKLYALLEDPAGGPPVFDDPVDAPAVSQVELTGSYVNNKLKGDGKTVDSRTVLENIAISLTYGKLAPEVLAVLDGGTATANAGETVSRYRRRGADKLPYFGLAALISEVDAPDGAAKLFAYKLKVTDGTLWSGATDAHGQPTFTAEGIPLESTDDIWDSDLEDVGTPLPITGAAFVAAMAALV